MTVNQKDLIYAALEGRPLTRPPVMLPYYMLVWEDRWTELTGEPISNFYQWLLRPRDHAAYYRLFAEKLPLDIFQPARWRDGRCTYEYFENTEIVTNEKGIFALDKKSGKFTPLPENPYDDDPAPVEKQIVFDKKDYSEAAGRALRFILRHMRGPDGRLLAVWMDGRARHAAALDGYAYLIWALIELYQADFNPDWLAGAEALARDALELFGGENGGLYYTGRDISDLPGRGINAWDGAVPSGQSVMAHNLIRLSRLLGREDLEQRARELIGSLASDAAHNPMGYAYLMAAQAYLEDGGAHVTIAGSQGAQAMLQAAREGCKPYLTIQYTPCEGPARAQVCARGRCSLPLGTAKTLAAHFKALCGEENEEKRL